MKKTTLSGLLIGMASLFAVLSCGGSGGGGGGGTPQSTTAVLMLSTSGALPTGTQIGGIDVAVNLPAGVTVNATPDPVNTSVLVTDSGVVVASGVGAGANTSALATYTPATSSAAGKVIIHMANPSGFGAGEFVTVNCDIAAGSYPVAADFSLTGLTVFDLNGAPISGLSAGFAADIR